MKASEYKAYKGLRKESLRDNMTDIEIALTNIGEIAARGGRVAKGARDLYEEETKISAISKENALNYQYKEDNKLIENK